MTDPIANDRLQDQLNAFASSVEGTSLYVLRAIDQTVDALDAVEKLARAVSTVANDLAKRISGRTVKKERFIDPDDVGINALESGYRALEAYLPTALTKKRAIDGDSHLNSDHCELLHVAYDRNIQAIAQLIESLKELRAAVISHDLAAELAPSEGFNTVGGLVNSLHSPSST
jgi:hypothetical protein